MAASGTVTVTRNTYGNVSSQILANNIEAYENTIPSMLSDRLRNTKFAGPANPQTGVAAEWEPRGNGMGSFHCKLVPGAYLSGHESQLIHTFCDQWAGILQAGVHVREGEEYEIELWARALDRPVQMVFELRFDGQYIAEENKPSISIDQAHWQRYTCKIPSPGTGDNAIFNIHVPGESRVFIDQIHLRPVGETHVAKAFLDAFSQFPCPVLRFPGGCVTCTYHWKNSVGPVHLRPVDDDPVFKYKLYYDFGTDEYLSLCAERNIRPLITFNTTTATAEECAEWAAYVRNWYVARKLPVPAAYFMVGNENFGIWESGHMTGDMYVRQLEAIVPLVRAAYPEARIMVIGAAESQGTRKEFRTPWRSEVLARAGHLFDVLVDTSYTGTHDNQPFADAMKAVANGVAAKSEDWSARAKEIQDAGLKCTMGVMEWNFWTRASHNDHAGFYEPNDIRHCLYGAGYINFFCRMGEMMETACYYSLVNTMGMIWVRDGKVTLSDMVKVMNLYAEALPGEALKLEVSSPALTEKASMIDANFVRKDGKLYGFLINYSADESCELALNGIGKVQECKGIKSGAILTPVEEFAASVNNGKLTLPPASLVRIVCQPA